MLPIYLFEDPFVDRLYPLTLSRPAFLLRCGAATLLERMVLGLGQPVTGLLVREGLADVVRSQVKLAVNPGVSTREGVVLVNARWLLLPGESPFGEGGIPAADSAGLAGNAIAWIHLSAESAAEINFSRLHEARTLEAVLPKVQRMTTKATLIQRPWDLLEHQRAALLADWERFGPDQRGEVGAGVQQLGQDNIHIGRNVKVSPMVVLDATAGPIVMEGSEEEGKGTVVQPFSLISGPCYIGPGCLIRAHADIRSDCSFGPGSHVGGEVIGSIFLGNANKQHHGFLGQSIIGEWANLGAGTTTSNLKNTYGDVRVPLNGVEESSGRAFMGSIVADHAKIGIGTYLSTGSVVGFASHVVAARPPKFVPSFAWVTSSAATGAVNITRIDFEKIVGLARMVMERRKVAFTHADQELFVRIAGDYAGREMFDWDSRTPRSGSPESP